MDLHLIPDDPRLQLRIEFNVHTYFALLHFAPAVCKDIDLFDDSIKNDDDDVLDGGTMRVSHGSDNRVYLLHTLNENIMDYLVDLLSYIR